MTLAQRLTAIFGAIACMIGALYAAPAAAQATRTWVSGVGDDLNPCSRTAPCKTFAGAISKTAPGGEINCLDPGAYGAVTIGKALSIICQYTEAGVLATLGSNGIVVNAGTSDHVYLSGLDIFGAGTGLNGIRFIAGASLTVENSIIRGFGNASGNGISFQPSGASRLNVSNTTINFNGAAGTGAGILVQPTGASGTARVVLDEVRIQSNNNIGLSVNTTGSTSAQGITVVVNESELSNNTSGITILQPAGTQNVGMTVIHSTVAANSGSGISAAGGGVIVRVSDTTITGNSPGVTTSSGGVINTYGDNLLDGNPTVGAPNNGSFTGVPIPKK